MEVYTVQPTAAKEQDKKLEPRKNTKKKKRNKLKVNVEELLSLIPSIRPP